MLEITEVKFRPHEPVNPRDNLLAMCSFMIGGDDWYGDRLRDLPFQVRGVRLLRGSNGKEYISFSKDFLPGSYIAREWAEEAVLEAWREEGRRGHPPSPFENEGGFGKEAR